MELALIIFLCLMIYMLVSYDSNYLSFISFCTIQHVHEIKTQSIPYKYKYLFLYSQLFESIFCQYFILL